MGWSNAGSGSYGSAASSERAQELAESLQSRFESRWDLSRVGDTLSWAPRRKVSSSAKKKTSVVLLGRSLESFWRQAGFAHPPLLPVTAPYKTDFIVSGVQGLDPWLISPPREPLRQGYLGQPVVRNIRDSTKPLVDGSLSAFVNASVIGTDTSISCYVNLLDDWLECLSTLGVHTGRLRLETRLLPWRREDVAGLTTFMRLDGKDFCDSSLMWNVRSPERLAYDSGTGVERLHWLLSGKSWHESVFGIGTTREAADVRDAIRAYVLLYSTGAVGRRRGGATIARLISRVPLEIALWGLNRAVAVECRFWEQFGVPTIAASIISSHLEEAVIRFDESRRSDAVGRGQRLQLRHPLS